MSQSLTLVEYTRRLVAWVPATVAQRTLTNRLLQPGELSRHPGATLFADISGFTSLTERLAVDGAHGTEELNRILLDIFTPLIETIRSMGGTISHFYGDAMVVYFLDYDNHAARRALSCAQRLQHQMQSMSRMRARRQNGSFLTFQLGMKIGVGYGECVEVLVGSADVGMEFVLAGSAVDTATNAEKQAKVGDIIVSSAAQQQLKTVDSLDTVVEHQLFISDATPLFSLRKNYQDIQLERTSEWVGHFIPSEILARLSADSQPTFAEHRPITSIFVQFDGLDPNSAQFGEWLNEYYLWAWSIVNRYASRNGRVNRILTGDKGNQLHIILGAPTAPQSPEQAMRLVLALQDDRPLFIAQQRIGIASGRAFASPLGSKVRHEYTIIGDVVNLSARLCSAAGPNEVWTNERTAQITNRAIKFERRPPTALKGMQAAIRPHIVRSEIAHPAQLQARYGRFFNNAMVIRLDELEELTEQLDMTLDGEGQTVFVRGEAGVGKSRFVAAVSDYWFSDGGVGFVGVCAEHSADTPYHPWITIFHALANLDPTAPIADQADDITQLLFDWHIPNIEDIPLLLEVLGYAMPLPDHLAKLDAATRKARLFNFVAGGLRSFTSNQPHLFVFEDLHWADQASRDLLDYMSRHIDDAQIAILATIRSEFESAEPLCKALTHPETMVIDLGHLEQDETRAYLHYLLDLDHQFIPKALEEHFGLTDSDSHTLVTPLFLEETLERMFALDILQHIDGILVVDDARLNALRLPDNVHGLLLERLDRLDHISREILEIAAVVGEQFEQVLVQTVGAFDQATLNNTLKELTLADLIRPLNSHSAITWMFRHGMMRDAAYQTLSVARRRELHARIAGFLEQHHQTKTHVHRAQLAHHYHQASKHNQAFAFAREAAKEAFRMYSIRDADRLYRIAVQNCLDHSSADYADVRLWRCRLQQLQGHLADAQTHGEIGLKTARLVQDAAILNRALALLGELSSAKRDYDQVMSYGHQLLTSSMNLPEEERLAYRAIAYLNLGKAAVNQQSYDDALTWYQRADAISARINDTRRQTVALEMEAYIYYERGQLTKALDAMQRVVQVARNDHSHPYDLWSYLNNVALLQRRIGRFTDASQTLLTALNEVGDSTLAIAASLRIEQACVFACQGNYHRAENAFQTALATLVGSQHRADLIEAYMSQAQFLYTETKEWRKAIDALHKAEQAIKDNQSQFQREQYAIWVRLAWAMLRNKDYNAATDYLNQAETHPHHGHTDNLAAEFYYCKGVLQAFTNHPAEAVALLKRALDAGSKSQTYSLVIRTSLQLSRLVVEAEESAEYFNNATVLADHCGTYADRQRLKTFEA